MQGLLMTIHIVVSVLLVLVVLVQSGRNGGIGGLMGGGGGDALFSTSSQQSGLRTTTLIIAGIFFATSVGLTVLGARQAGQTVFQKRFPALPPVNVPAKTQTNPLESIPGQPSKGSDIAAPKPAAEVPKSK